MKKILSLVLLALAVIGGIFAADMVKSRAVHSAEPSSHALEKDKKQSGSAHGKKSKKDKDKKSSGHSKSGYGDSVQYIKFKRQFVVPVIEGENVEALVILNINIELAEDAPDNSFGYEPKLRDAITRELLSIAYEGHFGENLTTPQTYEILRTRLVQAVKPVLGDYIQDVLILDLARQDK